MAPVWRPSNSPTHMTLFELRTSSALFTLVRSITFLRFILTKKSGGAGFLGGA